LKIKEGVAGVDVVNNLIFQLSEFVRSETGLYFPEKRWIDLKRGLKATARDLGFGDMGSFSRWLLSSSLTSEEHDILVDHLTVGETYFFRDKNLFQVLKDHILQGWIRTRHGSEKRIKIWSAGCCSGEEPYSMAMLLDQMMPVLNGWEISIAATDINNRFLSKAEKGIYTGWSLRDTPERIVDQYFIKRDGNRFEISPRIRKMVRFHQLNLAANGYPSATNRTGTMDLIFCRNVLMYFAPETISQIIDRLHYCLVDGGWLVVSPSETAFVEHADLHTVRFPGAILHRKGRPRKKTSHQIKKVIRTSRKKSASPEKKKRSKPARRKTDRVPEKAGGKSKHDAYQEAMRLYENKDYEKCAQKLTKLLSFGNNNGSPFLLRPEAMALLAKAMANMGKLDEAKTWCCQAVDTEKLNPGHRYLLATIYAEQSCLEESIEALNQALYLDPEFVLAHFQLGNLARRLDRPDLSRKHLVNARQLLESMDTEDPLPCSDGMTAGELLGLMTGDL